MDRADGTSQQAAGAPAPGPAEQGTAGTAGTGRAGRLGAGAARLTRAGTARVRAAAGADGAGESGLASLLGAHALSSAGDALVTVALAGTVFFAVPLGQARDRVAMYLVLTLLPFGLLVPVAGPVLDRFAHGRRNVLAATAGTRGLLAWSTAGLTASIGLYPLALGLLVLSRAYGVARSAALPRVRPAGVSPVAANARMNVAAVASASVAGAAGAGLGVLAGPPWVLRLASVVLLAAAVCAVRLPPHVDEARAAPGARVPRYRLLEGPLEVQRALVAAVALRGLAGLLTIFLAFLLKGQGAPAAVVVVVLGAAVAGQLVGTALAGRLPEHVTARLTLAQLAVPAAACLVAAVLGGPVPAAVAVGVAGLSYALSKFALDAALQTHVPPTGASGAFARSETGLQLAWAAGGGLAVLLPTVSPVGFAVAAGVPLLGVVAGSRAAAGRRVLPGAPWRRPAPAAPAEGPVPGGREHEAPVPAGREHEATAHEGTAGWAAASRDAPLPEPTPAGSRPTPAGPDRPGAAAPRARRLSDPSRRLSDPPGRLPRPRSPRAGRSSVVDRWRQQAGGAPPRTSRRREEPDV